jgi:hypothetical protein
LAARGCAPQSLLVELVSAQEPASAALTVVSATGGERQEALRVPALRPAPAARRARLTASPQSRAEVGAPVLTEVLHRLVAQPADQAATPLLSAVLASVARWRTAETTDGLARASAAMRVHALRLPAEPCPPTQPWALVLLLRPRQRPPGRLRRPPMAAPDETRPSRKRL